ncbi:MAG: response regulator transcription factor [Cyclobacteriaceae bacterium]
MKVLIVEDEKELLSSISTYLKMEGYVCEEAHDYHDGVMKINLYNYDCIIADIGLPGGSGLQLIEILKRKVDNTGIIIISAKNSLEDKIHGLDIGADDYLTKPFNLSELNARIRSVLRRRKFEGKKEIEFFEIHVNPETLQAFVKDKAILLTKKEFDLLVYFITNKNKVLTKESIVEHLWGDYIDSADSYDFLYAHISNLRKKLIEAGARDYLSTVYGVGYKFTANEAS